MSCDPYALATAGVKTLKPYQAGKAIETLEKELGLTEIVKLASNENPLGPSEKAMQAAQDKLIDAHRYPDAGGDVLKSALAEFYSLDANRITLGNGSNDVLDLICRAFLTPDDNIVISEYAFAVYHICATSLSAGVKVAKAKDFGHDLTAMTEAIDEHTKIVFIANPNNPTGTWLTNQALSDFMDTVPSHVLVVIDEAYAEYIIDTGYPHTWHWVHDFSNLIVTRTFSKAYGLAGLRAGYSISSPEVADLLNRVRQPFNMNIPAMYAAVAVLQDEGYLKQAREVNQSGYFQLTNALRDRGLTFIPSAGNFVTVDFKRDAMPLYEALLKQGVIVRPLVPYGLPQHLRVSIGLESENQFFLDKLDIVLS